MILITVHPDKVSSVALSSVDVVIATGDSASESIAQFARAVNIQPPAAEQTQPEPGQAMVWFRKQSAGTTLIKVYVTKGERRRHLRSYAEGQLSPEQSFYFRRPQGKLNLKAQNLMVFMQLAEGVDEDTWIYHLRRNDYSKWFREKIKDDKLGKAAEAIEQDQSLSALESRDHINEAIKQFVRCRHGSFHGPLAYRTLSSVLGWLSAPACGAERRAGAQQSCVISGGDQTK